MGFGFIIAGFLLLANPIVHVVDVFPDFLGFLLICCGLSRLCYLNSGFSSARELFLRLALVEVVRSACLVFVPYTEGSALVLFAFIFGVIELIFFLPAINYFFDGLNYVGMRYEGDSVFAKKGKGKEYGTSLKRFTVFFYVFRVIGTFVPELPELQMYDYFGVVSFHAVDYRRFKPLFYLFFGLIVFVLGIIFAIKAVRYFGRIRRDTSFISRLREKYDSFVVEKPWIFMGKRMKTVLTLYALSVLLSLGLYLESINAFPGILSAAVLAVCAVLLSKDVKAALVLLPVCVIRGALSVYGTILQKTYFIDDKFDATAVLYVERAAEQYSNMSMFLMIESAFALLSFVLFAVVLMKAVRRHLSETGTSNGSLQYSKENRDAEITRSIRTKLIVNQLFTLAHFVTAGLYLMILVNFPVIVALQPAVTVIWFLQTLNVNSHINDLLYTPLVNDAV